LAPGVPCGREVPGVAVMPGSTLPARLSIASLGVVPGPVSAAADGGAGGRLEAAGSERAARGRRGRRRGALAATKKTPVIPLDEVVAGR
jgi:hypothetical protein